MEIDLLPSWPVLIAVLLYALWQPAQRCPRCGNTIPVFSRPSSWRSWLLSRRCCPHCKAEISWLGRLLP